MDSSGSESCIRGEGFLSYSRRLDESRRRMNEKEIMLLHILSAWAEFTMSEHFSALSCDLMVFRTEAERGWLNKTSVDVSCSVRWSQHCTFSAHIILYFITFLSLYLRPSTVSHVHCGSPLISVTSPHLSANLITSLLPHNLTSFSLFYFEQRINPTESPPLLSCSSPRCPALAVILFLLLSLADSDDLLAVSHVHSDSSSMFLLLSTAPLLPLFIPFRCHSSSRLCGLTWYCHLLALLHLSLIVSLTLSSSSLEKTFGQDSVFTSTLLFTV